MLATAKGTTRKDVIEEIKAWERRFDESMRNLKYLEKNNAPKARIIEQKRIANFLESELLIRQTAFKFAEFQLQEMNK